MRVQHVASTEAHVFCDVTLGANGAIVADDCAVFNDRGGMNSRGHEAPWAPGADCMMRVRRPRTPAYRGEVWQRKRHTDYRQALWAWSIHPDDLLRRCPRLAGVLSSDTSPEYCRSQAAGSGRDLKSKSATDDKSQPGAGAQRGARVSRSSATGAPSFQACTASGNFSQGCFRFTQMWATTSSSSLRSSVPARITTMPGRALFKL